MNAILTIEESGWPADPLAHVLEVLKLLGAEPSVGAPSARALGRALARTRADSNEPGKLLEVLKLLGAEPSVGAPSARALGLALARNGADSDEPGVERAG